MRNTLKRKWTACRLGAIARDTLTVPTCLALGVLSAVPILMVCTSAQAAGAPPDVLVIMRVEEDWEVVLNEPGSDVNAPQFHTVMSPFGDLDSLYAQITWNYRELPDFEAGGLQIQADQNGQYPQDDFECGHHPIIFRGQISCQNREEQKRNSIPNNIGQGIDQRMGD